MKKADSQVRIVSLRSLCIFFVCFWIGFCIYRDLPYGYDKMANAIPCRYDDWSIFLPYAYDR